MSPRLTALVFVACLACSAAHADPVDPKTGDHTIERVKTAMGTTIQVTIWAEDDIAAAEAIAEVFTEFDRIDALMTTWTEDSDVSKVNSSAGKKRGVLVSDETLVVIQKALEGSKKTGGAFDITVGAFSGVWKFDQDKDGTIPDAKTVAERRKLVGWKDVVVDAKKKTIRLKRKGQKITLGGIAKGYAVDRAVGLLRARGFADFLVQAGGDMYIAGRRGDRGWRVGVRDPRGSDSTFFAVAVLEDVTFSTSGDYERFVLLDGRRYHHIIDPSTGYPADKCRQVTIVAKEAIAAEVLSKGLFIMGPTLGMKLVEKLPDVEAIIVGADNSVSISTGLKDKVTLLAQPTDAP